MKEYTEYEHDLFIEVTNSNGDEREVAAYLTGVWDYLQTGRGEEEANKFLVAMGLDEDDESPFSEHTREYDIDDGYMFCVSGWDQFNSKGNYTGNKGVMITFHDFPDELLPILKKRIEDFNKAKHRKGFFNPKIKGFQLVKRTKQVKEETVISEKV